MTRSRRNPKGLKAAMDRNEVLGKDLAFAVGVTQETVSRWRSESLSPSGGNLARVLKYLRRFEPALEAEDLLTADAVGAR